MQDIRVIVPLDGSQLAESALEYLRLIGWKLQEGEENGSSLHAKLISVVDAGAFHDLAGAATFEETQERLLKEYLAVKQQRLAQDQISVETHVAHGSAAQEIITEAASFAADLIILSSHGTSGNLQWRVGSVADKVIRLAPCDVLAVGPKSARAGMTSIHSILVPLDGSPIAELAIPRAQKLAALFGAQVKIMRILPPQPIIGEDAQVRDADSRAPEALLPGVDAYLASVLKRLGDVEIVPPIVGPVAESISDFVRNQSVDLVMTTSQAGGGVTPGGLGSVTSRLIGGPAPIVVVHPPGKGG